MEFSISELCRTYPVVSDIASAEEVAWQNPQLLPAADALPLTGVTSSDIEDAAARLERFAPFIMKCFPETSGNGGLIESPLTEIPEMKRFLNENFGAGLEGRLFLKRDSDLAIAGSVKARGGIYEILKHSEDLALEEGLLQPGDDYSVFASDEFRDFFSGYSVHVGSTGNLGLSIGIISAALGYSVSVHMSADAKEWKKALLRSKGVNVIEYASDYSKAVAEGRKLAQSDSRSYFVDDENSVTLFLGYAVAAARLEKQLKSMGITVGSDNPLYVYIPCGVGGAPGGICFGLKQVFGDNVRVYFVEPTQAPCMLLGLASGMQNGICVQDVGLTGKTEADGLAVGRPSGFVGKAISHLLSGEFTVEDSKLFTYLRALEKSENLFIEPSSCSAFAGPVNISRIDPGSVSANAVHIAWATGGSLVPEEERIKYRKMYL